MSAKLRKDARLIRLALLAAWAALAAPAAAAAQTCLAAGDPHTLLTGTVYALEAFDEAEADTVGRTREVDYYALVLAERVCVAGAAGRPAVHNVTVIRLDMPAEAAKGAVQQRVLVQGALAVDAEADAPPVMKVTGMKAAP